MRVEWEIHSMKVHLENLQELLENFPGVGLIKYYLTLTQTCQNGTESQMNVSNILRSGRASCRERA